MMTLVWPWSILQQSQIWSLFFVWEYAIEACEVKVGTYSQINEYMMIYDRPRSRSFIDLWPRSLRFSISNFFSSKNTRLFEAKFHMEPPWDVGMKICSTVPGHMTKMASRPIYGENLQTSPSEPRDRWPWNVVYSIEYSDTTKFVQMMTQVWPWTFLWHGQICFSNASAWVKAYTT